jgi:hypothetical protein
MSSIIIKETRADKTEKKSFNITKLNWLRFACYKRALNNPFWERDHLSIDTSIDLALQCNYPTYLAMTFIPEKLVDGEGSFPIPFVTDYRHVVLDPSKPKLSDEQRAALKYNIEVRDWTCNMISTDVI